MTKFTVLLDGKETKVKLQKPIEIGPHKMLKLKTAVVVWEYHNVSAARQNNTIVIEGVKKVFPGGYHTLFAIKDYLNEQKVMLEYDLSTFKCSLETKRPVQLRGFGQLLGFNKNQDILATKEGDRCKQRAADDNHFM